MAPTELDSLLHILRDRDIPLGEDDVAWAFENPKTRADATFWFREYLQPPTLLTKDELDFHEKRGSGSQPLDAASGRPLSDEELEAAIASLEESTAAIEKQCEILQTQKLALQEIQSRNAAGDALPSAKDVQQKKTAREKAQLDFDINDKAQNTETNLRAFIKQTDAATSNIPSQVDRILEKDDRLLDGLQKLLPKISDSSLDSDDSALVEELCSALTTLSVRQVRARLDAVYHETVLENTQQLNGSHGKDLSDAQKKQRDNLRAELEELGTEIDGLVGIVVDQQYRKPLKQGVLAVQADMKLQKARWSEYTISALAYLTARLDALGDHVQQMHAHGSALKTMSATLEELLAAQPATAGASNTTPSPVMDRSNPRGLKPLRLVQANFAENQDPAVQFLRQNDIRVAESDTAAKLSDMLYSTLRDRHVRLATLDESTEQAITGSTAQSFARSEASLQDILGAVYSLSKHNTVRLVDSGVQAGIDSLESDTQSLGDQMRELDVDSIARSVNAKQAEVIRRLRTK